MCLNLCRFIEPTILVDPPLDSAIMSDEIFGPLLPIITVSLMQIKTCDNKISIFFSLALIIAYIALPHAFAYIFISTTWRTSSIFFFPVNNLQLEKIEDSIKFISSRPKPLALYVFTKNQTLQSRMISETSSGSVNFNDAILQVVYPNQYLLLMFYAYFELQIHLAPVHMYNLNWLYVFVVCSMQLILSHLEEWVKVGLACTMGNSPLTHSATRRRLWEEVS